MGKPNHLPSKINGVEIFDLYSEIQEDKRGSLTEIARTDWIGRSSIAMAYISVTEPGVTRGPHKHDKQVDWFYFIPGTKGQVGLSDDRLESTTRGVVQLIDIDSDDSIAIVIPPGVIHWYKNLECNKLMTVINLPSELYRGYNYEEDPDEVRYED